MRKAAFVAFAAFVLSLAAAPSFAGLIGAGVQGTLAWDGREGNGFDMSGGSGWRAIDASGSSRTIDAGAVEFWFLDAATALTIDFDADRLVLQMAPRNDGGLRNGARLTFGLPGSAFPYLALDASTFASLDWQLKDGEIALGFGQEDLGPEGLTATFTLGAPAPQFRTVMEPAAIVQPVPEPATLTLLAAGLAAAAARRRRTR
jgi:hypothetical protein